MFALDSKIHEDADDDFILDVGPQSRRRKYKDQAEKPRRKSGTFEGQLDDHKTRAAWSRVDDQDIGDMGDYEDNRIGELDPDEGYEPPRAPDNIETGSVMSDAPPLLARYLDEQSEQPRSVSSRPGSSSNSIAREYQAGMGSPQVNSRSARRKSSSPAGSFVGNQGSSAMKYGMDMDDIASMQSTQLESDLQNSLQNLENLRRPTQS